jgi:hypothetical protein
VIKAGGSTLADTYARVTGQPANGAYNAFNALLQAHIAGSTTNNMLRDNIFPLLDVTHRRIQLTVGDPVDQRDMTDATPVSWVLKPGLVCPAAPYDFLRQHQLIEQPVFARALGTANAAFRWTVGGTEIPVRNAWTNVVVNTAVTMKNPDGTVTPVANAVALQYGILDVWNGSALYLKTVNWNGNCELPVTVTAKETGIVEAEATGDESVSLTTVSWIPGAALQKDRQRCNPYYVLVNDTFWYLTEQLSDVKNRPDPAPERVVREIARAVEKVQQAVALYAKAGDQSVAEVWQQLGTHNALRSADPVAPAIDMARLKVRDVGHEPGPSAATTKPPSGS